MQLVLAEDVPHLGHMGDVVTVKAGYARNYLLPRKLAVVATPRNVKQLEHQKRVIAKRAEKRVQEAQSRAQRLEGISITLARRVTEEEKLYGSVTPRDIEHALQDEGFDVDHRSIEVPQAIKNLGVFNVKIHLAPQVSVDIKVWVVAEE
jgi:large subunit ribosomal protein L9